MRAADPALAPPPPAPDRRWLWVMRGGAIVTLFTLIALAVAEPHDFLVILFPGALYGAIALAKPTASLLRSAAVLGILGAALLGVALVMGDLSMGEAAVAALALAAQLAIFAGAVKTHLSLPRAAWRAQHDAAEQPLAPAERSAAALWSARAGALVVLALVALLPLRLDPWIAMVFYAILVGAPYLLFLARRPSRRAAGWGMTLGVLGGVLSLLALAGITFGALTRRPPWAEVALPLSLAAGFLAGHALLFFGSRRIEPAPAAPYAHLRATFLRGFIYFFCVFLFVGTTLPSVLGPSRTQANASSAVGTLRSISVAVEAYAAIYDQLPETLAVLGPPRRGDKESAAAANLLDPARACAGACEHSGYRFAYQRLDATSYHVSARPLIFPTTGTRSFLLVATGDIRFTDEDREATISDPRLD